MPLRSLLLVVTALALPSLSAGAPPEIPDFSADQEMSIGGKATGTAKLAVSGPRTRYENTTAGRKLTVLTDREAKKSWVILPAPVGCLVGPVRSDVKDDLRPGGGDAKEERLGTETLDGHPTEKVKLTWTVDGKSREQTQWRATDLKNLPIKTVFVGDQGEVQSRLKNVVLGVPDAKLFAPPADCKPTPPGFFRGTESAVPKDAKDASAGSEKSPR